MDSIQERLAEMERENPSSNFHNRNFLQRIKDSTFFTIREIKDWPSVSKEFSFTSIYQDSREREKDYQKAIKEFDIDEYSLDAMEETLFQVRFNGINPRGYLPGYGKAVKKECFPKFQEMAYELFKHVLEEQR